MLASRPPLLNGETFKTLFWVFLENDLRHTFKMMCKRWKKNQAKNNDGLIWIGKLFRPTWWKSLLYLLVNPFMLKKDPKSLGRGVRRLPFRKAHKRDNWSQSVSAQEVGDKWAEFRKSGSRISFTNDSDSSSVPKP